MSRTLLDVQDTAPCLQFSEISTEEEVWADLEDLENIDLIETESNTMLDVSSDTVAQINNQTLYVDRLTQAISTIHSNDATHITENFLPTRNLITPPAQITQAI